MGSQQKNDYIRRLKEKNCPITWHFLWIGLVGPGHLTPKLDYVSVINHALDLVLAGNQSDDVNRIAYADENEQEIIKESLANLKKKENPAEEQRALKKWQKLLIEDLLKSLPNDAVDGLAELTSFWGQFDFPDDSPHIVQARSNSLTPQEYYTQENYESALKRHREWLMHCEGNS